MKALSIRHPSIEALLAGRTAIEVRGYATRHRGELLLHAVAAFGRREREELERLRGRGVELREPAPGERGALVGLAQLVNCRRMTEDDWEAALVEPREGDWWAWELEAIEALPEPVPCRGRLFMWDVPDTELEAALTHS